MHRVARQRRGFRFAGYVLTIALAVLAGAFPVAAHEISGVAEGFGSGFMHPLKGPDHMAAMVAVGLWGAFLGVLALWLLPVIFPLVMAWGGILGILGVPIPYVEIGIALSAVALGLAVALALRPPIWAAGVLIAIFAIFHGYAHGVELPEATNAIGYSAGFVVATGFLHLLGIGFGFLLSFSFGEWMIRGGGVLIALVGVIYLLG